MKKIIQIEVDFKEFCYSSLQLENGDFVNTVAVAVRDFKNKEIELELNLNQIKIVDE